MKKVILLLLAGSLLIFNGCKKTGPQGPAGPAGQNGVDGNANVNGSNPFTVYAADWTWSAANHYYSVSFNVPAITPSIVDKGIVEVFISYATNVWTNLPYTVGITQTAFDFTDNTLTIYVLNSDNSTPANPGTQIFRTVIISASQKQANPKTNWKNYNEAMAAINTVNAPAVSQ